MKNSIWGAVPAALLTALLAVASTAAHADRLDDIKRAGVLRVAAFDSNPPFGFVDPKNNRIIGLDVDYANAVAKRLGVKLEIQPTNPANLPTSARRKWISVRLTLHRARSSLRKRAC